MRRGQRANEPYQAIAVLTELEGNPFQSRLRFDVTSGNASAEAVAPPASPYQIDRAGARNTRQPATQVAAFRFVAVQRGPRLRECLLTHVLRVRHVADDAERDAFDCRAQNLELCTECFIPVRFELVQGHEPHTRKAEATATCRSDSRR